ncbi:MAG: hypothetical protein LUG16_03365, partial [Candidatus Gastranaerophilales bacterium]|nr:hypothetical protein [Candidatus Gastranaerophilales bacterium]
KQVNETENNNDYINFEESAKIFSEFSDNKYNSQPSFKSSIITKAAENIMLSPVKNMMVLDMGISGERLATARTKGEFQEFAIKEGSFLFFVYGAGKLIQKGIDTVSEKLFKTPIKLDSKFLTSKLSENILSDSKMQNDIDIFCKKFAANKNDSALYEYIFKNPENTVVKAAKESGIITMMKDKKNIGEIDTRKYIDSEKIKNLAKDLKTFVNIGSKENQKKFLNRVKTFKVASTILNVAICCFALGYAVPKMMYKHRKNNQNGQSSFHVRTEYEKELKKREENSLKQKNV